jgi:LacI family transcriptional regulator
VLGYGLLLDLLHSPDDDNVDAILNVLSARRVDGIIWAIHEIGHNRAWIAAERLASLPPVVFLTMQPQPGIPIINTDNSMGAKLATQHLVAQGCRVIGHISGPEAWWETRERKRGWRCALHDAGREIPESLLVVGDWTAPSGEAGLRRLLAQRPDTDAVFAANDQMALGVLRAAHQLGRRVPEDLAVVGYDNTPECAYFWPSLTSVRQRLADAGKLAIQTLHALVEARRSGHDDPPPLVQTLSPELVVRESSLRRG